MEERIPQYRRIPSLYTRGAKGDPVLETGSLAPAFTVKDHEGNELSLSDFRGRKVLLWFYPKANTPG